MPYFAAFSGWRRKAIAASASSTAPAMLKAPGEPQLPR